MMKKTVLLLCALIIVISSLSSCGMENIFDSIIQDKSDVIGFFPLDSGSESEHLNVYLTLFDAEYIDGAWRIDVLWHNDTGRNVVYGKAYTIEYQNGEKWEDVTTADVEFIEIACIAAPYSTAKETYTTKWFDVSRAGRYRLRSSFSIEGESTSKTISIAFELAATDKIDAPGLVREYDLRIHGSEWLYESAPKRVAPGTEVTLKVKSDQNVFVSINRKYVPKRSAQSSEGYSYLDFTMPNEPVDIYFIECDDLGVDEFPMACPFLFTYAAKYPTSNIKFEKYYGQYYGESGESCQVAMMTGLNGFGELWVEKVEGVSIIYNDSDRIVVYQDFEIYTLTEAYEQGILTLEEIEKIAGRHADNFPWLYAKG